MLEKAAVRKSAPVLPVFPPQKFSKVPGAWGGGGEGGEELAGPEPHPDWARLTQDTSLVSPWKCNHFCGRRWAVLATGQQPKAWGEGQA